MRNFKDFRIEEIVNIDLRATQAFNKLGIEYSQCSGQTLKEVCTIKDINPETVLDYMVEAILEDRT